MYESMKIKRIPTVRSRLVALVLACIIPVSLLVATVIVLDHASGVKDAGSRVFVSDIPVRT